MPQVPVAQTFKNVRFQAAYTSLTFNKKNDAFYRINGVLDGMDVTNFSPSTLRVSMGAFIQRGIIVELLSDFLVPKPAFPFPWTIYATTDDEVATSPTTIDVAPSGSEPAGVVILATTADGDNFIHPKKISIKHLRQELTEIENERKIRTNLLTNGGFELLNIYKGLSFVMPGPVMDAWQADNLSDKAPGSRIDIVTDPLQTLRGGAAVLLTSESYLDPGGVQPDLTVLPPRVLGNARIYQPIEQYRELIGEPLTLGVSLRLPPGHPTQLHDLEIAIYGSSLGTVGFSDTPVDKFSLVIPSATLSQNWQKFWVHGTIRNLNTGLAAAPLPAFPGISIRIAYINSEPATFPTGVIDKVLIDDVMLYQGTVHDPVFFPIVRAVDWLRAEHLFEAEVFETTQLGMSTDIEYRLGETRAYRSKKFFPPSMSHENIVVSEDGSPFSANAEAAFSKFLLSVGTDEYRFLVSKAIAGFRPARLSAILRSQA